MIKKVSCKTIPWCMLMIHRLGIHSCWHQCKVVSVWIPVAENPVCIFMLTTSTTQSWNTSFGWWMFKEMLHNYHCVNWNELFYMFCDSPWFIALLPCCTIPSLHSSPILDHIYWLGYITRYIWTVFKTWSTPVNSFFCAFGDTWQVSQFAGTFGWEMGCIFCTFEYAAVLTCDTESQNR